MGDCGNCIRQVAPPGEYNLQSFLFTMLLRRKEVAFFDQLIFVGCITQKLRTDFGEILWRDWAWPKEEMLLSRIFLPLGNSSLLSLLYLPGGSATFGEGSRLFVIASNTRIFVYFFFLTMLLFFGEVFCVIML